MKTTLLWIWAMELVREVVSDPVGRLLVRSLVTKVLVIRLRKPVSALHRLPAPYCPKLTGLNPNLAVTFHS